MIADLAGKGALLVVVVVPTDDRLVLSEPIVGPSAEERDQEEEAHERKHLANAAGPLNVHEHHDDKVGLHSRDSEGDDVVDVVAPLLVLGDDVPDIDLSGGDSKRHQERQLECRRYVH